MFCAYLLWDIFFKDLAAIPGYHSREPSGDWWIHPECLIQAGQHVIKLVDRSHVNLILALERRADLFGQFSKGCWVRQKEICHSCQKGRCGL